MDERNVNAADTPENAEVQPESQKKGLFKKLRKVAPSRQKGQDKIQDIRKSRSGCVLLLIAAALIAVVSFAYSTIGSIVDSAVSPNATAISDWMYAWGTSENQIAGDLENYRQATKTQPVARSGEGGYLRLSYSLPALEQSAVLKILTDHAPARVELDGVTVADTGFGRIEYSGGSAVMVPVGASRARQTVDVYLTVPFSMELSAALEPLSDVVSGNNFFEVAKMAAACSVLLVGIILIIISVFLSIRNKNLEKMLIIGLASMFLAASMFMRLAHSGSMAMADGMFFNLEMLLEMILVQTVMLVSVQRFGELDGRTSIPLIVVLIGSVVCAFMPTALLLRIVSAAFAMLVVFAAVRINPLFVREIGNGKGSARVCYVAYLFIMISYVIDRLLFALGVTQITKELVFIGALFYFCVNFVHFYRDSIDVSVRQYERERQVERDSECIGNITGVISSVFVQRNRAEFLIKAATGVRDIIVDNVYNATNEKEYPAPTKPIKFCIAVAAEGGFNEIYNDGPVANCDYQMIAEHYRDSGCKTLFFGNSFFDLVFVNREKIEAIVHFENLEKGLEARFESIVITACSSILIAYDNLTLKNDMILTQETVFVTLAETVECRSVETSRHLKIVAEITKVLCEQIGLSDYDTRLASAASMVHDVGKIAVPERILDKPGALTDEEREIMKNHTTFGRNILSQSPGNYMSTAAAIAFEHHEHYDGTGYWGKKGEDINIYARMVAIADVFDALVTKRIYKEAWPYQEAIDYIVERAGTHFDPNLVKAFSDCIDKIIAIKTFYINEIKMSQPSNRILRDTAGNSADGAAEMISEIGEVEKSIEPAAESIEFAPEPAPEPEPEEAAEGIEPEPAPEPEPEEAAEGIEPEPEPEPETFDGAAEAVLGFGVEPQQQLFAANSEPSPSARAAGTAARPAAARPASARPASARPASARPAAARPASARPAAARPASARPAAARNNGKNGTPPTGRR